MLYLFQTIGDKVMSRNVNTWLVEEIIPETNKISYSKSFESYDEAHAMYEYLKNKKSNTVLSMNKQIKRLLVE